MANEKKDTKQKFVANWRIDGLLKDSVEPGKVVELVPEDAAALVECGALSPADAEAKG